LSTRFVCIHGHFYQPPRENPWLEAIELQDSAYPYHDWNERITAECYGPNATPRILDGSNRIVSIENNYARISFNFGPTLLSWMEKNSPEVYAAVLEADRSSVGRFSGHGSALAQAYNHVILPLANRRDKVTQVQWGIRDFTRRFGRFPEGMWLPETAVDTESLEVLAEHQIGFTILAPHQAVRVRRLGEDAWRDVSDGRIDPRRPYRVNLPSGRAIAVFFYDAPVSRGVAFERLLERGELLVERLLAAFAAQVEGDQLVHIAADGETYGHHHRFGDMALAYALHHIETNGGARLTNYAEYLASHPAEHEVAIVENTSWSCPHGVGRWKEDCGCRSRPDTQQAWRAPLRQALDELREALAPQFEAKARDLFEDPWAARDDYIAVILDRSPANRDAFLSRHAARALTPAEQIAAVQLMELQRHALLMYTSCGWFFDDIAGIEARQVLQYAGRAIDLGEQLFGAWPGLEGRFLERLAEAKSNDIERRDGRKVYEDFVQPARVDLEKVGAHYAVSSLFEKYEDHTDIYCYTVDREDYELLPSGRARLALGRARIASQVTGESDRVSFGVLHLGDQNVTGGIGRFASEEVYRDVVRDLSETFTRGDLAAVLRLVDQNFSSETYSLSLLFRDEQRKIVGAILNQTLAAADATYRRLYERNLPLMHFLHDNGIPVPRGLRVAAELALTTALRRALDADPPELQSIATALGQADRVGLRLPEDGLGYAFRRTAERLARHWRERPENLPALSGLHALATFAQSLPFRVEFWNAQNLFYEVLRSVYPAIAARARDGDAAARDWVGAFRALGEKLAVLVPE
jgi:alpha-amylase/alpha-mannosidase (GH57 family)